MENFSEDRENLKDFLHEAELQQYYELFRDTLKVTKLSQLKFVVTDDLVQIGLSKPEQRRYKKIYSKYFPNPYISKIKKLLNSNRKNDQYLQAHSSMPLEFQPVSESSVKVPTKHIIPIEDITINKELGMGQFGVVQQGTWTTGNQRLQVAIKCLGNERMTSNSTEFLKEAAVMHSVSHPSIVRLYGVVLHLDSLMLIYDICDAIPGIMLFNAYIRSGLEYNAMVWDPKEDVQTLLIEKVTELAPLRSLLECLREASLRASFPVAALCRFAEQIANGMAYLENKRLIHRDLAARNILVFSKDKVKISDFGLSRALGVGKDYYQTNYNVNLKLPVAWCAPECILYLRFTSASDVWAWGVCLWEMFTYGFQPWAGFSGHQILEAIDSPNHQRLERPECCSEQYYGMMQQCWAHEPRQRPTFRELQRNLPTIRPDQVQATVSFKALEEGRRSNMLEYKAGQVITVLGRESMTESSLWYGALDGGACGVFEPAHTTPYVKPERVLGSPRTSLLRSDVKRHTFTSGGGGKRGVVRRGMISAPQGDLKHTSHVGFDGAYFGDISFLDPAVCVPRGVVAPYDAARDAEQQPLLPPHSPTAPFPLLPRPQHLNLNANAKTKSLKKSSHKSILDPSTSKSILNKVRGADEPHEYHEISDTDTESTALEGAPAPGTPATPRTPDSPAVSKSMDFSQSLLDEMESLFRSIDRRDGDASAASKTNDAPVRAHTMSKAERKRAAVVAAASGADTMKPMSAHDERTLDNAVALANQITTRSMNEIAGGTDNKPPQSPSEKGKFQLKFPRHHHDADAHKNMERRNFSEEAKSVPDIQATLTEQSRLAYASLIEQPAPALALVALGAATVPKPAAPRAPIRFHSLQKHPHHRPTSVGDVDARVSDGDHIQNELPLPPRTSKPKLVDKPRHVRKYPLKLPGSGTAEPRVTAAGQAAIYQNAVCHREIALNTMCAAGGGNGVDVFDGVSTNPFSPSSNPFTSYLTAEDHAQREHDEESSLVKESAVSTEDLLQFAARAPCGRQRGAESDEVRVISKVLHQRASPEQCLEALELCEWDVHLAIKTIRVALAVAAGGEEGGEPSPPPLVACRDHLQRAQGDVLKASAALLLASRHK